jgi:protocatechuate 3,4-dioxygenase beta subunit
MNLLAGNMVSRHIENRGFPVRCARYLSIPLLAALLAFTGCSAATPIETPDAGSAVTVLSPTVLPPAQTLPSSPRPAEAISPVLNCNSPAALTPAMTEGPYFKAGSPERQSLIEDDMTGAHITITGYVLTADCRPVPHAFLDFWQADAEGVYDNSGYRMRGHQSTDETGRYQLETVMPGQYPGRTPHIHVNVQAPGGPLLTTQLYFPDEPGNDTDSIFSPQLLVTVQKSNGGIEATFDFIVAGQ